MTFDFNDIQIDTVTQDIKELASKGLAYRNLEIPVKALFRVLYNIDAPVGCSVKSKIGNYPAWFNIHEDRPNVPKSISKCLFKISLGKRDMNYEWNKPVEATSSYTCTSQEYANLTGKYTISLFDAGFKLVSNMQQETNRFGKTDLYLPENELDYDLAKCINAILEYVVRKPCNVKDNIFGKNQIVDDQFNQLFYRIFVSPDKGILVIDHITYYNDPKTLSYNRYTDVPHINITQSPKFLCMPMVVFTNSIGYIIQDTVKGFEKQSKDFERKKREMNFIKELETYNGVTVLRTDISTTYPPCRPAPAPIMKDRNGHIWYGAAYPYSYVPYKNKTHIPPQSMIELAGPMDDPDAPVNRLTQVCSSAKNWHICILHPKIRGYRNIKAKGIILYQTNDPEWSEKILGRGAAEYLRKYTDTYNNSQRYNYELGYSFIWYDDYAMEMYDKFIDNEIEKVVQLKEELRKRKS